MYFIIVSFHASLSKQGKRRFFVWLSPVLSQIRKKDSCKDCNSSTDIYRLILRLCPDVLKVAALSDQEMKYSSSLFERSFESQADCAVGRDYGLKSASGMKKPACAGCERPLSSMHLELEKLIISKI